MTDANDDQQSANKFNEDDFFEMLTRSQSKRMDDQRCSLKVMAAAAVAAATATTKDSTRKPLQQQNTNSATASVGCGAVPKENRYAIVFFLEMASNSSFLFVFRNALLSMIADLQSERMDEQRAMLPGLVNRRLSSPHNNGPPQPSNSNATNSTTAALDEGFLDMLMRSQVNLITCMAFGEVPI